MRRTHGRGVTEGPELRPGPTTNQQLLRAESRGLPSDVHLTSHARDLGTKRTVTRLHIETPMLPRGDANAESRGESAVDTRSGSDGRVGARNGLSLRCPR